MRSTLKEHLENYKLNRLAYMHQLNDDKEIYSIVDYLKNEKIRCVKYNSALDDRYQKAASFQSYLYLSEDGRRVIIINKKMSNEANYILEVDPIEIEKKK